MLVLLLLLIEFKLEDTNFPFADFNFIPLITSSVSEISYKSMLL